VALPGLLWVAFILGGLLGLGRAFAVERENDCLDGLILAPGDKGGLYLGKVAGTSVLMLGMEVAFVVGVGVFYNIDLWAAGPRLFLVGAAGTVGFAAVGTLFAAMTAHLRAREVLLPVLLLPFVVPVLLAAVHLTEATLSGASWTESLAWWQLLLSFDVAFVAAGTLLFEFILEA
jgi:heme exporter protein B